MTQVNTGIFEETLQEIAALLRSSEPLDAVLRQIFAVLEKQLGPLWPAIRLNGFEGERLRLGMVEQEETNPFRAMNRQTQETGRRIRLGPFSREPESLWWARKLCGQASEKFYFIVVPIGLDEGAAGAFSILVEVPQPLSPESWELFLCAVANLIADNVHARRMSIREKRRLEAEVLRLRHALGENMRPASLIGSSQVMDRLFLHIRQSAESSLPLVIYGEPGVGKEEAARAVHGQSPRRNGPFLVANGARGDEKRLEAELFGMEKGSNGEERPWKKGFMEEADGGTLFIDDLPEVPLPLQKQLCRVLREGEIAPPNGGLSRRIDVRIIVAASCPLEEAVERGKLRPDLFECLNGMALEIPPLRKRREDIPPLVHHFAESLAAQTGKPIYRLTTAALNAMMAYHWPGNVRELESCVEHAARRSPDGVLHCHYLPPALQMPVAGAGGESGRLKTQVEMLEKDLMIDALKQHEGRVKQAAEELGLTNRMFRYKMQKLGLHNRDYRPEGKSL